MIEKGQENKKLARYAALQGMVLLKNEGETLPLTAKVTKAAVFGIGQTHTFKGGTGSGDVNNRETISILQGLKENAAFHIDESLEAVYKQWGQLHPAVYEYAVCKTSCYEELPVDWVDWENAAKNDVAIMVISHTSGEDSDRKLIRGDYYLSEGEAVLIKKIHEMFSKTIVLINTSSVIDLKEVEPNCEAILYISMPGQEGGHAVADILCGNATPSGKLTDTWAVNWREYPSSLCFGDIRRNGNWNYRTHGRTAEGGVEQTYVEYQEGIYNGYRYFNTFGVRPAYSFGFGLSYTEFSHQITEFSYASGNVTVSCSVKNCGDSYCGREVIQVYVSAPDGILEKPFKELKGFAKTGLLAPGEEEILSIKIDGKSLASYDAQRNCWILEAGYYDVYVGNSLESSSYVSSVEVKKEICVSRNRSLAGIRHPFPLLSKSMDGISRPEPDRKGMEIYEIKQEDITTQVHRYTLPSERIAIQQEKGVMWQDVMDGKAALQEFVAQMDVDTMAELVCGIGMEMFKLNAEFVIGNLDKGLVPGCAGMTRENQKYGIPPMILADGPAGLRIHREVKDECGAVVMHQNCTAYPVGTLLASSWDEELLYQVGESVGEEMRLFGVDLWLAPGMNIHRNPLCGRNFEYYSEDPLLTGRMAAAITRGVQSRGVGVTIKHLAANNQEDLRANSDSRVDERTLREIYLQAFAIAIREAQPWAVMTSYNDINGVPAADNFDLCTGFVKDECGHKGLIMTDWGAGLAQSALAIAAGNDMIQPGGTDVKRSITAWCDKGMLRSKGEAHVTAYLTRAKLEDCLIRCLGVLKTAQQNKRKILSED